jgi:hypothetical protein
MNFRWLLCLPFILMPGVMSLAQQMTIHDSCVKVLEEDFADDTITLCPSSLPPIKTIHVEGSHGDAKAQEPDCNTFRPDAATVRRYFSKARQISDQEWIHKLTWITCEASGSMTLQDGRKARWGLGPNRSALVRIEGEPYQKYFLFCSKADCGFPPFW